MNVCVLTAGEDEQLFVNNFAQICNYLKPIKQNQNENFDINEYKSDSEFSAKKISFKDIKSEISNKILNNSTYFEHIRSSSSNVEIDQKYEKFSNEAYANLMVLVTKYKLSNIARNAIILFFNKHSKYSTLPLPKNIRQRKEFINDIKSNLLYKKTKVLDLDDTEYFLYYMPLISCIENILKISDIVQNLEFEYKELYKTT
ncbi:zn-finger domain-containing protein [Gigaspora margarita]|uniref:Zn-finger domain-containing protein n=1 Tax=Gigaspora margarita TaxID=4874 RepID=A0A8H4EGK8_GIGMA|nr:zn-finger domain-containing protein [Gigaspora margarita]